MDVFIAVVIVAILALTVKDKPSQEEELMARILELNPGAKADSFMGYMIIVGPEGLVLPTLPSDYKDGWISFGPGNARILIVDSSLHPYDGVVTFNGGVP